MSRTKWREETIAELSKANIPLPIIRKLLRYGATLHRLAEAQCNGDWPADDGQRTIQACQGAEELGCGRGWAPSALKGKRKLCPDCYTEELIHATCAAVGLIPVISGDPRGAVLCVKLPGQTEQDRGIFVA